VNTLLSVGRPRDSLRGILGEFIPKFTMARPMDKKDEEAVARQLGTVPLFEHLSDRQVRGVAKTGQVRAFAAGERVVGKGEKGVGFYLLLDGRMEVKSESKLLANLAPGNFFGEMALFEDEPRSADVVAAVPSRCLVLSRWEFWGAMSREPETLRALMVELVRRLRATPKALSD